jgi:hypothetical protein
MKLKIPMPSDERPKWYAHQILRDLIDALNWIEDSDDKDGIALIVEPLRAKYNLSNNQP